MVPLEESHLIEPFKEKNGRWVYETFGVNPCVLGCVLCLASDIKEKDAAVTAKDQFRKIRSFYREARAACGRDKDMVFAPGARILSQVV